MNNYFRDPILVELLSDPLTHAVMRADHVNPQELENLLCDLARRRADSLLRPASGSASADHLKRRGKEIS
jgi:hypothetical protein